MKTSHIVLNSNRWFSAITDYSLQLVRFLHLNNHNVIVGIPGESHLHSYCRNLAVPIFNLPLWPPNPHNQARCWKKLTTILLQYAHTPTIIWTFEGREHTLCAVHRKLHPSLWRHVRLARVRGQAAPAKDNMTNRWLYRRATDAVIFVADVVAQRTPFMNGCSHAIVQPYCCDSNNPLPSNGVSLATKLQHVPLTLGEHAPPTFAVIGRYDPVKGHSWLMQAFANAKFSASEDKAQLVFLGKSENIKANDLANEAAKLLGGAKSSQDHVFCISDLEEHKKIVIIDDRISDPYNLMRSVHFGVIPSLGSEVICRVAVEFFQQRTPIICSDAGALPQIASSPAFPAVATEDTEQMINALEKAATLIAKQPNDFEELRSIASQRGHNLFGLHEFEKLRQQVINLAFGG